MSRMLDRLYEYAMEQRRQAELRRQRNLLEDQLAQEEYARTGPEFIMPPESEAEPVPVPEDVGFTDAIPAKYQTANLGSLLGKKMREFDYSGQVTLDEGASPAAVARGLASPSDMRILRGEEAQKYLDDLGRKFREQAAITEAYSKDSSFVGEVASDVIAQPQQSLSVLGAMLGGKVGGAALAAPAMNDAFFMEYAAKRLAGLDPDASSRDAAAKMGIEGLTEMIPGMGKLSSLGKSVLGKVTAQGVVGGLEETAADIGARGYDLAARALEDEQAQQAYEKLDNPLTAGGLARTFAGGFAGGALFGLPGAAVQVEAEKEADRVRKIAEEAAKNPETAATADGIKVAADVRDALLGRRGEANKDIGENIFDQQLGGADTNFLNVKGLGPTSVSAADIAASGIPKVEAKPKPAEVKKAAYEALAPEQGSLFDPVQGSLFGEPVDAAQAEASRARAAQALQPEEVVLDGDGAGNVTGTVFNQPQTSTTQARSLATKERLKQEEIDRGAEQAIDFSRATVQMGPIREQAKQIAKTKKISPELEATTKNYLRAKYPLAFSGQSNATAREQQAAAAQEYSSVLKADMDAITNVLKFDAVRKSREDVASAKTLLQERATGQEQALEKQTRDNINRKNQPVPEQGEIAFRSPDGPLFDNASQVQRQPEPAPKAGATPTVNLTENRPLTSMSFKLGKKGGPTFSAPDVVETGASIPDTQIPVSGMGFGAPSLPRTTKINMTRGETLTKKEAEKKGAKPTADAAQAAKEREDIAALAKQAEKDLAAKKPSSNIQFDTGTKEMETLSIVARQTKEDKQAVKLRRNFLVEKVKDGATLAKFLNSQRKFRESAPENARLLDRLLASPALKDVKFEVLTKDAAKKKFGTEGLGGYRSDINTIFVRDSEGLDVDEVHGVDNEVLLHELAHAVTAREVDAVQQGKSKSVTAKQAYGELVLLRNKLTDEFKNQKLTKAEQELVNRALKTEDELIAYTYTSPDFRRLLRNETPGLFGKLKEIIAKLANWYKNGKPDVDIANRVMDLADKIADAQRRSEERGVSYQKKYSPDSEANNYDIPAGTPFNESDYSPAVVNWAKNRWGDDIAPNGRPVWQNFTEWFGDSLVVNDKGEPLVLYHGTSKDVDFGNFKVPGNGAWFTEDPKEASMYAMDNDSQSAKYNPDTRRFDETNTASRVMPVFLKITEPGVLTRQDEEDLKTASNYRRMQKQIFDRLRYQGFNGVNTGNGIWVVIDQNDRTLVKSATGNTGDFSPRKANVSEMGDVVDASGLMNQRRKMTEVQRRRVDAASFVKSVLPRITSIKDKHDVIRELIKQGVPSDTLYGIGFELDMAESLFFNAQQAIEYSTYDDMVKNNRQDPLNSREAYEGYADMIEAALDMFLQDANKRINNMPESPRKYVLSNILNKATANKVNEMAAPTKPGAAEIRADVTFRPGVATLDTTQTNLGPIQRFVKTLFSSTGKNTPKAQEAIDWANQQAEAQLVQIDASRHRLEAKAEAAGYDLKPGDYTNKRILELYNNPQTTEVAKELAYIKNIINQLTLANMAMYRESTGKNISDKELAVLAKAEANLDEYLTRSYKIDVSQKLGKTASLISYFGRKKARKGVFTPLSETISSQWTGQIANDYLNWKEEVKTNPDAKPSEFAQLFIDAREQIASKMLHYRDNWQEKASMSHLEDMYKVWYGQEWRYQGQGDNRAAKTADKRAALVEELKKFESLSGDKVIELAESHVMSLLDRDKEGKPTKIGSGYYRQYYRGGEQIDKTILTPRENVPPAIRALMGEIKDPMATIFLTAQKLTALASSQSYFLNELRENRGKLIFDDLTQVPPDLNAKELIPAGQMYGALAGKYTTPRHMETLKVKAEAGNLNLGLLGDVAPENLGAFALYSAMTGPWARLMGMGKAIAVFLTPAGYAANLIGAPLNLMTNANFNPKTYSAAVKVAWEVMSGKDRINPSDMMLEILKAGVTDTALVGEFQRDIRQGIYDSILQELEPTGFKKYKLIDKGMNLATTIRERVVDVYSMMDLWVKFANYINDKQQMKEFYDRQGIKYTESDLIRTAAERTKRSNLTQKRATALVRATERIGLSTFAIYFTETYRAMLGSLVMGASDVVTGNKYGDTKLRNYGIKRMLGSVGGLYAFNNAMYAGIQYLVENFMLDPDDEEDEKIRKIIEGMGDFVSGKVLLPIGKDADGNYEFFELTRLDPNDPVASPLRLLTEGRFEDALKAVAGLAFLNPVAQGMINAAFKPDKQSILEAQAPQAYQALGETMADSTVINALSDVTGEGPEQVSNRIILALERLLAPALVRGVAKQTLDPKEQDTTTAMLRMVGMSPITFNVKDNSRFVAGKYNASMSELRDNVRGLTQFVTPDTLDRLENEYLSSLEAEHKAFTELSKFVQAADAAGVRPTQYIQYLKDQRVPSDLVLRARQGVFRSVMLTPTFLDGVEEELARRTSPQEARQRMAKMRQELLKLQNKYRNYNGEEN